jgi:apolipoprotein N-acyltransferase
VDSVPQPRTRALAEHLARVIPAHVTPWRAAAVVISGAAFVAVFPPFDLGWLAWVCLVPLLLAADRRTPREAFWLGYAWGVVAFGGVLWWITGFGAGVWALAALFVGVFPAVAMGAAAWLRDRAAGRILDPFLIAVAWTAVECLRSHGPLAFPWALLGTSQHRTLVVAQLAGLVGVYGITFLIVVANGALASLVTRRGALVSLALAGAMVAATVVWGRAALGAPQPASRIVGKAEVAVVQPEYATRLTWDPVQAARDLAVLGRLTHEAAARGAALVVWPETASPTDIAGDPATLALLRAWAVDDHVALIASSLEGARTNSAFAIAPDGVLQGRYDKSRLVPFAEFGERPGHGPAVLPTPLGPVGMAICFESAFPEIARQSVLHGAGLLAVITNDAWFGRGAAPVQHAAIAPFRAIEEGRYLLRAANGGSSEIIDPHGRVVAALPAGERGVLTGTVFVLRGLTFYACVGHLFGWATVLATAVLLLPGARDWFAGRSREAGFARLLVVSFAPLAALVAALLLLQVGVPGPAVGSAIVPLPMLALLAASVLLTLGRPARLLGFRRAGFAPASAAGLAAVAGCAGLAMRAVALHGITPDPVPPPGGWWLGGAVQVAVVGLALEWWLRGLVWEAAAAWNGRASALVWSTLLGAVAAVPRGPEAMVWGLVSGVALGLIRSRWRQVPALALAHGVGNTLLWFLIAPW